MSSYKNKLQEWCQANNKAFPEYSSISSGSAHNPKWTASVNVNDKVYTSVTSYSSKVFAEQDVAQLALMAISSIRLNPELEKKILNNNEDKYICFVDLENINYPIISKPDNVIIYCYLSSYSTVDTSTWEKVSNIFKIDSAISDAADHLMTYEIGKLVNQIPKSTKIIIASRDRMSAVLTQLLTTDGYQVIHVKFAKDLKAILE